MVDVKNTHVGKRISDLADSLPAPEQEQTKEYLAQGNVFLARYYLREGQKRAAKEAVRLKLERGRG